MKGVVHLADEAGSTRLYQGYWRLENGNVPVQSSGGAKAETVVVLELTQGHARAARAHGHRRDRRPGRAAAPGDHWARARCIELKNTGKVTHELSTPDNPTVMPVETADAGRTAPPAKFDAPGGYLIR